MTDSYCVVLGDVVGSREIADRPSFQDQLTAAIDQINERHADALAADFAILKGVDEIGGVLESVRPIAAVQRTLARAVHPEQIRIAAVVGRIDVNPDGTRISMMDGTALSEADETLSTLESETLTFSLEGEHPEFDRLISDEINLLDMIRADWSERQLEVITEYERLGTQKAVADSLGVSPQAISKSLRTARAKRVLAIEERLEATLQSYPAIGATADEGTGGRNERDQ